MRIRSIPSTALWAAIFLTGCVAIPALAASAPDARLAAARASMTGTWTGSLGYRDYQNNRLTELPVSTTIEVVPDGVTQVRQSRFDEGRSRPAVWITSVSAVDSKSGELVTATFREGRAAELTTEIVTITKYETATHWTLVSRRTGADGDAQAEIRVTETREGNAWKAVKDVRPIGATDTDWRFRNQTVLQLTD